MLLHADSEVSDQTGRMPRLIHVFAGRTCHFVGFVMLRRNWLANSAKKKKKKIRLKKSSLMVIMLPLIIFCYYRVTAYYFAQAWILFILHRDALRTESTLFTEVLFHRTCALQTPFYFQFNIWKFSHPHIAHRTWTFQTWIFHTGTFRWKVFYIGLKDHHYSVNVSR